MRVSRRSLGLVLWGAIAAAVVLWPGAGAAAAPGAPAVVAPLPIPGADVATDAAGTLDFDRARQLPFAPAAGFRNPGTASAFHPLVLWLRFPASVLIGPSPQFLETAPLVGRATLYYQPPASRAYRTIDFGMRVPMRDRRIARASPTVRVPAVDPKSLAYLRLSVDEESHVIPLVRIVDETAMRQDDAANARIASTALVFIGAFVSLAAANLFVFFFIREFAYVAYTGWMLVTALFAATYLHDSAWTWLWPGASLPETVPPTIACQLQGVLLLTFARSFLHSRRLAPRADRVATWAAVGFITAGIVLALGFPSAHFGPVLTGRDLFMLGIGGYLLTVFALAVAVMLAGSKPARFFVASNAFILIPGVVLVLSNLSHNLLESSSFFLALMLAQGLQGWLLFGALAYRLRQVVREFMDEQQRRIVAQSEALVQARALLEQRRVASTDALTGIANRRSFDETLTREWDRCARSQQPLSLLLGDVDYFKAFNDTYGHVLGDDCLRRVAQALATCVKRPGDVCARYGGEEFAVILAETDAAGAQAVAREACANVRDLAIPHAGSSLGVVTISLGIATLVPAIGSDPAITEAADEQLYRAKEGGRNRSASSSALDEGAARAERAVAVRLELR